MALSREPEPTPISHVVRCALLVAIATLPARSVLAQRTEIAKVIAPNDVTAPLPNVTTTKGTGTSAASAMAGGMTTGKGATLDPAAGMGAPFDDTVPYGNSTALSRIQTEILGGRLSKAYPDIPIPKGGVLALGEGIRYNVDGPKDKVGPALGPQGFAQVESTALASTATNNAYGEGSLKSLPNDTNKKAVDVTGAATASIFGNPFNPNGGDGLGFAVGIIKDPITYTLTSLGTSSSIFESIGDSSNPLSIEASIPGSFGTAFYDFGTDQTGTLVSFSIGIDSQTQSIDQVDFQVNDLNPLLGFDTVDDFKNDILSYLTFDPSAHSLSASDGIPLYEVQLQGNAASELQGDPASMSLWYTAGAVVGSAAVPGPSSIVLLGLGLTGLLATRLTIRRRRP